MPSPRSTAPLLAAALALCAACGGGEPAPRGGGAATESIERLAGFAFTPAFDGRGRSVVLVSVDTLRADHLACYGFERLATPTFDRAAREGVRFETCVSACPLTLPSHATMLTGSYPFVHGARANGTFELAAANATLPELLKREGYATRAEVASLVLDREYGLPQGFDHYGAVGDGAPGTDVDLGEGAVELAQLERNAEAITERGLAHLAELSAGGAPYFLFLHYYDPHQPLVAPEPWRSRHADGYLAEIAYVDAQLARLFDAIEALAPDRRPLVVLTSDHGEGLGEHGEDWHGGFLYDSTLLVPLILWCPGLLPAGRVVPEQVGLIDVAPTVLDLLRVLPAAQTQGRSLLPLVAEGGARPRAAYYSETLDPLMLHGYSMLRALREDARKYVHAPVPEVYFVDEDPRELDDRAAAAPGEVARLRARLRGLIAAAPERVSTGARRAADAQLQQLELLGYLAPEGLDDASDPRLWGDELEHFEPVGENPRDHAREIGLIFRGRALMLAGNFAAAEQALRDVLDAEPDNALALSYLAQTYAGWGRAKEAIELYERALELDPAYCRQAYVLASLLAREGELARAERWFRHTLACEPDYAPAALGLARALALEERDEEALELLERATALDPALVDAWLVRLRLLLRGERAEEGEAVLRAAEAALPRHAELVLGAVRVLAEAGRDGRAVQALARARERMPAEPGIAIAQVRWLACCPEEELRDGEAALRLARQLERAAGGRNAAVLGALAAAQAEVGSFAEALGSAEAALALARGRGAEEQARRLDLELALYRAGRPCRRP